jgi:hypothetical protein
LFQITGIIHSDPIIYRLKDWEGESISGSFYEQELQKTEVNKKLDLVEEILGYRTVRGEKQALIKWLGWSDKYNSWVPVSRVENL